uniref:Putative secreted protein n=1 Tax=Anopheles darlingi TaxID=43151 RepID=A0A2M4D4L8_ANODA
MSVCEVLLITLFASTVFGGCFLSVKSITSFDSSSSRNCGSRLTLLAARLSAVWRIFCFKNRCCSCACRSASLFSK